MHSANLLTLLALTAFIAIQCVQTTSSSGDRSTPPLFTVVSDEESVDIARALIQAMYDDTGVHGNVITKQELPATPSEISNHCDIILSIDNDWVNSLERSSVLKDDPKIVGSDIIVMWSNSTEPSLRGMRSLQYDALGLPEPANSQYGKTIEYAINKYRLYNYVDEKGIKVPYLRDVNRQILNGEVQFALTSKSMMFRKEMKGFDDWATIRFAEIPKVSYYVATINDFTGDRRAIKRFVDFLSSKKGQSKLFELGFELPTE